MGKDSKVMVINRLIMGGDITEFNQIFDHYRKTPLSNDIGIRFDRIQNMINDINEIKAGDIFIFSNYFQVTPEAIFKLVIKQAQKRPTKKGKNS